MLTVGEIILHKRQKSNRKTWKDTLPVSASPQLAMDAAPSRRHRNDKGPAASIP